MSNRFYAWVSIVFVLFLAVISQAFIGADTFINGAGASFPYPLYSKWIRFYHEQNPQVKINYQSIGSGGGIRQVIQGTVDFGASDAPMNVHEVKKAKQNILHIPTVLGSVVVAYNLPELTEELKLTPELLVGIYLGELKTWNHPKIVRLNPELKNESAHILPVRRSDGSGTTAVFTDYLAKVSPIWKMEVGEGKSLKWPVGLGGKGNEGVTGLVKQNQGAIGYIEFTYAASSGLPIAFLQNSSGHFVTPTLEAISKSAQGVEMPKDFRVSITNSADPEAYPITAFTYLLVPENMPSKKAKVLLQFLEWAMTEGQSLAPELRYAPLPESIVSKVKENLKELPVKSHGPI